RGWWMKPDPDGQPAVTKWTVMGRTAYAGNDLGRAAPQRSLPPCGGGTGRGVTADAESAATALPTPPPQGGREAARRVASESLQNVPVSATQHFSWLALEPVTGRTHQLRVHCAAQGWPIVGDTIYGKAPRIGGPSLHLHSREIVVPLYKNRDPIKVMAPVPLAMQERLYACAWPGEGLELVD